MLAYLFLRLAWRRAALLMLSWGALVLFAIVYLAHHYVIDAVGGVVYAIAAYWLVRRALDESWAQRLLAIWRGRLGTTRPST
ncbi:MAG TPA: phosphatase PAP2 family protein [Gemmatimonadales bacterium]|nr:phosphatase PAP2 family protein [Gemmatimonadales bacterium]